MVAWPVELRTAGPEFVYLDFLATSRRPIVLPVLTLDGLVGFRFEWKSWLWQLRQRAAACAPLAPGVRAVRIGDADEPIAALAAKSGFWGLDANFIRKLCTALDLSLIGVPTSLFETMLEATKKILGCTEAEALSYCHLRVVSLRRQATYSRQLLQVDEAARCLDGNDQKVMKEHQDDAKTKETELSSFKGEYKAKKRAVTKACAKKPAKGSGNRAEKKKKQVTQMPLVSTIRHEDIKMFTPEGGYVWKANRTCEWIGRCPPDASCSRSWGRYGEAEALRLVLIHVWTQWCDQHGVPYAECPMRGILDSEPILGGSGGDVAASST